jgi:hypothetical protein
MQLLRARLPLPHGFAFFLDLSASLSLEEEAAPLAAATGIVVGGDGGCSLVVVTPCLPFRGEITYSSSSICVGRGEVRVTMISSWLWCDVMPCGLMHHESSREHVRLDYSCNLDCPSLCPGNPPCCATWPREVGCPRPGWAPTVKRARPPAAPRRGAVALLRPASPGVALRLPNSSSCSLGLAPLVLRLRFIASEVLTIEPFTRPSGAPVPAPAPAPARQAWP